MTFPKYRDNSKITPFTMLCPGISQNTEHHQLTLYKGHVWRQKSYHELCNNNVLHILVDPDRLYYGDKIAKRFEFIVPPTPGNGFRLGFYPYIPWDSEILQSFAEMTDITSISFHPFSDQENIENMIDYEDFKYQIHIGRYFCFVGHQYMCLPPHSYYSNYIWTKESFKIQIKFFSF